MIKLFISDFDGTLLNGMHVLDEETTKAIHALRDSGVHFLPASGRAYSMIQQILAPIGVQVKCIALNGGLFFDNDGNVQISYKIEPDTTVRVNEIVSKYDCLTDFYMEKDRVTLLQDNIKANYLDFFMRSSDATLGNIVHLLESLDFDNEIISVKDIKRIAEVGAVKIESQFTNLEDRASCLAELYQLEGVAVTSSYGKNVEVSSTLATKGDMAEAVCERYGYKKEEVVVIGDNYNDLSMITRFPNSYAMGNAVGDVIKAANYQADTNVNLGVAKVMYDVIEKNKKEKK